MAGTSSKAKTTSKVSTEGNPIETDSTTTTVVTSLEETVDSLEFKKDSSVLEVTKVDVTTTTSTTSTTTSVAIDAARDLPIFRNPLIVDAAISALGPLSIKPKAGRVKASGTSKTATVSVLKLTAPKAEGEVVVMRRMDSDLVNATSMFNAAYPSISHEIEEKENDHVQSKYDAVVEKAGSGVLTGVWVTIAQAKELAQEYGIDQFIQPLLEAPPRKGTIKANTAATVVISAPTLVESSTKEVIKKQEQQSQEAEEEENKPSPEKVVVTEEISVKEEVVEVDDEVKEETEVTKETEEVVETNEDSEAEQEDQKTKGVMKRRIEELEEEVTRDRKRYRLLTVAAVGLVAAAALPQVLPYFS
ncbi:hypothetical protein BGZ46_008916 [Entomortierella lignicola]|nr:hypothetical protein BGZ46_008916 [Entomortierella lignicola]